MDYKLRLYSTAIFLSVIRPSVTSIAYGTKWCGPGNIAANYSDLGDIFTETDKCCRDHDHCEDIMEANTTKHGLYNHDRLTKLHCDCEFEFVKCLNKSTDVYFSYMIGIVYYRWRLFCYKKDHPIVKCEKYQGGSVPRCIKYKLNQSQPKIWQWFDMAYYSEPSTFEKVAFALYALLYKKSSYELDKPLKLKINKK